MTKSEYRKYTGQFLFGKKGITTVSITMLSIYLKAVSKVAANVKMLCDGRA
ncbi:MAG TPA: hypothetical protein PKM40_03035 [Bacteroidia bacterium]|nr:hypothetical protein [Bacteroidia bacterium]